MLRFNLDPVLSLPTIHASRVRLVMKYLTNVILFFITSSSAHAETDVLKGQFASKWRTETCSEGSEKKDFFQKPL